MNQKPVVGYGSQFALLLGLLGVCLIMSGLLMGLLVGQLLNLPLLKAADALLKPQNIQLSRIVNTLGTFIAFFVPAWAVAKISYKNPSYTMGFNRFASSKQFILVAAISIGALFLSGSLGVLNEIIPMPASFLRKAKALEENYKSAMLSMATIRNWGDYIISLVVIAIAPAIFEEVMFRGGMQRVLIGWTNNAFVGILITSIIFSAIHGSYFGFLPRLGLGVVLGLIYYQTKNIWLSITMHFLNNAIVVTQLYFLILSGKTVEKAMDETMANTSTTTSIILGVVAIGMLIPLFIQLKKESKLVLANAPVNILAEPKMETYDESMD